MAQARVVVQVVTYRTPGIEEELDRLFTSLAAVQAPAGGWALAIIDNPSASGNMETYLRKKVLPRAGKDLPNITLQVNEKNTGFAGGHMDAYALSLEYAPEFVYLLNQDTHVAPDVLTEVIAAAEANPRAAIVQSRIMMGDEVHVNSVGNAMHYLGFGFTLGYKDRYEPGKTLQEQRHGLPMFYASGAGVLLRVAMQQKIGGMFDRSYFLYHEDLDISWRARLAGYDVAYAEASVVYHHYEFSRSITKFYWMERNRHLTNLINYKILTVLCMLPPLLIMEAGTFAFALKGGWWREKLRVWRELFRPSTWRFIRERRRFVRSIRTKPDAEMLRHMVGVITSQEVQNPLMTYVANPVLALYFRFLKALVRW